MRGAATYIDTSALAKWYLNEAGSTEFAAWIQAAPEPTISSLTIVEMRSLLSRHCRMGHFDHATETRLLRSFSQDVDERFLAVIPVDDDALRAATHVLDRLADLPICTLDALHLTLCGMLEGATLATADTMMGEAAEELGLTVVRFP